MERCPLDERYKFDGVVFPVGWSQGEAGLQGDL